MHQLPRISDAIRHRSCELGNGVSYVNKNGVTGLVVPPRDPQALAAALNRLLEDTTLRIRMGEAGYARAKSEFTLERMWGGWWRFIARC